MDGKLNPWYGLSRSCGGAEAVQKPGFESRLRRRTGLVGLVVNDAALEKHPQTRNRAPLRGGRPVGDVFRIFARGSSAPPAAIAL